MDLDLNSGHAADTNIGTGALELQLDVDNTGLSPDERDKSTGQAEIIHKGIGSRSIRRSCDRCHAQKLKCSGGRASFSQCFRCQRVGLSCTYSARSARKTAQKSNGLGDSTVQKDVQNTWQPEIPLLDEIDLASLDTSLTMSFDMAQDSDGLISSRSSQDWTWWGQPTERYITEQGERSIAISTPKPASLDFIPLNTSHQATTGSESSNGIGTHQSDLFQSLADLSQNLESVLDRIATAWPEQDIQSCTYYAASPPSVFIELYKLTPQVIDPIGEVFSAFKKLPLILQEGKPPNTPHLNSQTNAGDLHKGMKSKDALLAVHCYVLCVKILAPISERLYLHLSSLDKPTAQTPQRSSGSLKQRRSPINNIEIGNGGPDIPLRPGLRLGELYSQFDPFGHALNCACATISTGVRLLRDAEVILGVPLEQGVMAEGSVMSPRTPGSDSVLTFPARLVAIMWDEESIDTERNSSNATALAMLRRHRIAISRLARQCRLLLPRRFGDLICEL